MLGVEFIILLFFSTGAKADKCLDESESDEERVDDPVEESLSEMSSVDPNEEYIGEESQVSASSSVDIVPSAENVQNTVPAIRPSYFPNVPPYLNFCLHSEQVESLPPLVRKHLKWRWSSITPVVVKKTIENSGEDKQGNFKVKSDHNNS